MNQPQVIELQQVVGNITDSLGLVFDCMEVAEGEIDAAKRRARNEDEKQCDSRIVSLHAPDRGASR